jgi:antitoxin component YwqK of YwqJK toxin-antitoxin module
MRFFTLLAFFLSFFCGAAAQTSLVAEIDTVNYVDSTGKRQGYWIIYGSAQKDRSYNANAIVEEGNYVNSFKTGKWTSYWPNKNKKSEMTYINNRPNGNAVFYLENGQKSEEGNWVGVRWVGEYRSYYENDSLQHHFFYNAVGLRDGKQYYYYPNGKLKTMNEVESGKNHGWTRQYDDTGKLIKEIYYSDGIVTSEIVPDTAKPKGISPKSEAIQAAFNSLGCSCTTTGQPVTLYKDGKVAMKGSFREKKLVCGIQYIYDASGNLIQVKMYREGKYTGDVAFPEE